MPMLRKAKERMVLGSRYDYYLEDKVIGSVWVEKQLHNRLYIWDVEVKFGYRNQGYGEKMIRELIQRFPDKTIFLRVRFENDAAINLYSKLGFKKTDYTYNYITMERKGDEVWQ